MKIHSVFRAIRARCALWPLLLAGLWALLRVSVAAMGGYDKLWTFERMMESRFTAMAILTGTLKLRNGLAKVGGDEQVFNGAGYTNWGFGVPLLQVPFHALAAHLKSLPQKFFPDRTIYFIYLALAIPVVWAAFDRALARREAVGASRVRRHALSWSATLLALTVCLYPLMSARFIIYEETICYFIVFELLALSGYVFAMSSWRPAAVAMIGIASGVALLVRPTGLVLMGMWGVLVALESRHKRQSLAVFGAAVAPFVAFWMYSNWVRTGASFAIGFSNTNPGYPWHLPVVRFGSRCGNTTRHVVQDISRLFRGFFLTPSEVPNPLPPAPPNPEPWSQKCHFDWELRPPDAESYSKEPFFGLAVLVLLAWMLLSHLMRRRRQLSGYLPFATMAFLFAEFVWAGAGFAWRYEGDFWPIILLACVQYVRSLPTPASRILGWRLALVFSVCSFALYVRNIEPALSTLEMIEKDSPSTRAEWISMWDDFKGSRWSEDPPLAPVAKCGEHHSWPFHNFQGWESNCYVDVATNVYLGVPAKSDDRYVFHFHTRHVSSPTLRVYINGRYYTAHKAGDDYTADVLIDRRRLTSPIVMTSIEWTHDLEPIAREELLSVDLT